MNILQDQSGKSNEGVIIGLLWGGVIFGVIAGLLSRGNETIIMIAAIVGAIFGFSLWLYLFGFLDGFGQGIIGYRCRLKAAELQHTTDPVWTVEQYACCHVWSNSPGTDADTSSFESRCQICGARMLVTKRELPPKPEYDWEKTPLPSDDPTFVCAEEE